MERSPFDSAVIDGQRCVFRKVFHPEEDLGLAHHKIDGVAVFPGVLGVEFGVQAAEHFIGKPMVEITEVEFKAPIKFHHGKELTVEFSVEKISETQFDIQVLSVFKTPKGLERTKSHFEMKSSISCLSPSELVRYPVAEFCTPTRKSIYDLYFHGESFQVIDWVESLAANGAVAHSFDFKSGWVRNFPAESMTTSPAARELGFQTAGVWEMNTTGKMNLPARIAKVQRRSAVVGEYAVRAIVSQSLEGSGAIDVWVYDTSGNLCDTMIGYETVELRELSKDESANFTPWDLGGDATLIHIQEIKRSITLDGGRALLGYLSDKEMATYSEKKSEKRRLDWSAGRIASKVSLQRRLFQEENIWVPAHHISVEPNALGEPQVLIGGELNRAWSISITHSAGWALAQVGECSKERLGLDVESVESRHPSWGKTYFSENEQKVAWESGGTWLLTACWAVKEALMKALGIGARVDFREIEVQKHEGIWSVTLADSLKMRLLELGAGVSEVTVHLFGDRVLARVKLSMIESTGTVRPKTTEEMPVGHFTSIVAGTRYEIGE